MNKGYSPMTETRNFREPKTPDSDYSSQEVSTPVSPTVTPRSAKGGSTQRFQEPQFTSHCVGGLVLETESLFQNSQE